jgi:hypothetical protein
MRTLRSGCVVAIAGMAIACAGTGDDKDVGAGDGIATAPMNDDGDDAAPNEDEDDGGFSAQTVFNFNVADDRGAFEHVDMEYAATFGPYALYEITGTDPHLVGPRVRFDRTSTWTLLCASTEYFTADPAATPASVVLLGGPEGTDAIAVQSLVPEPVDGCSDPSDIVNKRPPEFASPTGGVERIALGFDPAPPVGAHVLLQQIGIVAFEPGHNNSHVIPSICCESSAPDCELQP